MHDFLIRGGTVYDGAGSPGVAGDIAIAGGRITAIGRVDGPAQCEIDATGLAVAPGFIDIKTHSDFTLPINPDGREQVRQGVTTEIVGHCGFSVAPALPGKVELLRTICRRARRGCRSARRAFPIISTAFPATATNAGMLVGHNTLRLMVMGMAAARRARPNSRR